MCATIVNDTGPVDSTGDITTDPSSLAVLRTAQRAWPTGDLCIGHVAPSPWEHSQSSALELHRATAGPATVKD